MKIINARAAMYQRTMTCEKNEIQIYDEQLSLEWSLYLLLIIDVLYYYKNDFVLVAQIIFQIRDVCLLDLIRKLYEK